MKLSLSQIQDGHARDNFQKLQDFLADQAVLRSSFKILEFTFSKNGANQRVSHNLGFQPKDLIQTSLRGSGTLTWNYSRFDGQYLDATISGTSGEDPLVVRIMVGAHSEEQNA